MKREQCITVESKGVILKSVFLNCSESKNQHVSVNHFNYISHKCSERLKCW